MTTPPFSSHGPEKPAKPARPAKTLDLRKMLAAAGPYPMAAFEFVREGLASTVERLHGDEELGPGHPGRHVTGQQLCLGLRDYAIEQFGLLAPAVLDHWHIHRTEDFGRIVFAMIDANILSRTEDDSIEDFRGVYDFAEAFSRDALLAGIGVRVGSQV